MDAGTRSPWCGAVLRSQAWTTPRSRGLRRPDPPQPEAAPASSSSVDDPAPVLRIVSPTDADAPGAAASIWSDLDESNADAAIAGAGRRSSAPLGPEFEWKRFGYDQPADLPDRLERAGLRSRTTTRRWSSARSTWSRDRLRRRAGRRTASRSRLVTTRGPGRGLGRHRRAQPGGVGRGPRLADDRAAPRSIAARRPTACDPCRRGGRRGSSAPPGSTSTHGTEFASRCGAARTLPEWRRKGIYQALVARRAVQARERGFRYPAGRRVAGQPADPRAARPATLTSTRDGARTYVAAVTRSGVVVVGGDAAGMSAASQAKRRARRRPRGRRARARPPRVVLGVRHPLLGRRRRRLGRRRWSPARRRSTGATASTCGCGTRSTAIDLDRREVDGPRPRAAASTYRLGFDQLVIATGAVPVPPGPARRRRARHPRRADPGRRRRGCSTRWRRDRPQHGGRRRRRLHRHRDGRGDGAPRADGHGASTGPREPMATLDPDMGRLVHAGDGGHGHRRAHRGRGRAASRPTRRPRARRWSTGDGTIRRRHRGARHRRRARTRRWRRRRGLPLGASGGLRHRPADAGRRRTTASGPAGDCVETLDRVSRQPGARRARAPTRTSRAGCSGTNLGGGYATFPGVVGTAISKVCDLEIARTGLRGGRRRRGRASRSSRSRSSRPPGPATSRAPRR